MPKLLVAGVSTDAVCGVRDYAAVLEPVLGEAGFSVETLWWQRDPAAGLRDELRQARAFAAEAARRAAGADLVVLHYSVFSFGFRGLPVLTPLVARAVAGAPTVVILHELAYPWGRSGWRGAALAVTQRVALVPLLRAAAGAVVTTEDRARWLRSRRWLPRRRVLFVPVPSNLPPSVDGAARADRGMLVGILGFRRDGLTAPVVTAAVARAGARLRLLGAPGPHSGEAERWRRAAREAGCPLEFSGILEPAALARALSETDVVVFSDEAGPTSRKGSLAAALAAGKPVVALDGPQRWEALVSDEAVLLAPPDTEGLAGALERLRDEPSLGQALGERAVRFYRERMAPPVVAAQLAPFLRSFVREARARVALVAHDIHDRGGMERAFAELIRRGHRDYRFVVVSATLDPELRPLAEWRRVPVPGRPFPLKFVLFFLAAGARLLTVRADLVHVLGAIVPRRADVATVQFCHAGFRVSAGRLAPEGLPVLRRANTALTRLLSLAAERRCYRPGRVRLLAPVSGGVARELERHYPGPPLTVTPNGVDTSRFRPDADVRAAVRAELGAAADDVVLVFVGGDWDRKGLGITIGALARAPDRLRLWVVGPGPEARFRALAREHGVERRVTFMGARSDAERFYQGADVFVLPTLYETFSIAAHEAAAAALPVVATAVSGIAELVGADEAGILVERDEAAVATALTRLARDYGLRARLGAEARRRAQRLDWDRSSRSVLAAYSSLLSEARC